MVSSPHNVAAKGFFIAMVSTIVETGDPGAELVPGLELLGSIREKYVFLFLLAPVYCSFSEFCYSFIQSVCVVCANGFIYVNNVFTC